MVHKCTSPTVEHFPRIDLPLAQSGKLLVLRLYKSINECTSPLVKHLPPVDDPCMQSRTTPRCQILSWCHIRRNYHQDTSTSKNSERTKKIWLQIRLLKKRLFWVSMNFFQSGSERSRGPCIITDQQCNVMQCKLH